MLFSFFVTAGVVLFGSGVVSGTVGFVVGLVVTSTCIIGFCVASAIHITYP